MLNVIAQTAYPYSAASARVRIAGFAPFLAEFGVDLDYRPTLTETQYASVADGQWSAAKLAALVASATPVARRPRATSGGLLLVHRLRSLLPVPLLEFAARIDAYDFDDAMFAATDLGAGMGPRLVKAEARRWARYVKAARLVIAGNAHLASAARGRARRVEVVPSCVDPSRYALREHQDRPVVTIGWVGSRTTSPFLAPVLPVVERLNRDRVRARLVVVGEARCRTYAASSSERGRSTGRRRISPSSTSGSCPCPTTRGREENAATRCSSTLPPAFPSSRAQSE